MANAPVCSARILSHWSERPSTYFDVACFAITPSKPSATACSKSGFSDADEVVGESKGTEARQHLTEYPLSFGECNRPGVETLESDDVKAKERRGEAGAARVISRRLDSRPRCWSSWKLGVPSSSRTTISPSMTRCSKGRRRIAEAISGKRAVASCPLRYLRTTARFTLRGDESIAVVFDLEEPIVIAERRVGGLCEHHIQIRSVDGRFGGSGLEQAVPEPLPSVAAFSEILHGETGEDRLFVELALPLTMPSVGLLDEEPLGRVLLHLYERPLSVELVAGEREEELPFRHTVARILIPRQGAPVPHDHLPAAVFARSGMTPSKSACIRAGGPPCAPRNRFTEGSMDTPAGTADDIKDAGAVQSQVVVQSARCMLLDDEVSPTGPAPSHRTARALRWLISARYGPRRSLSEGDTTSSCDAMLGGARTVYRTNIVCWPVTPRSGGRGDF